MVEWIDVEEVARQYKEVVKQIISEANLNCSLWVFSCGNNPASEAYVRGTKKDCEEVGISFNEVKFTLDDINSIVPIIKTLTNNPHNNIIIQSPIGREYLERNLMNLISYSSDADFLSVESIGRMYLTGENYPAMAYGLKLLLKHLNYEDLSGKRAVVVGRSVLAGAPCAKVLQDMGATVTVIHSKSKDYSDILKSANFVVLAAGVQGMFNENDFSDGTIIFDVGINRGEDGKLHGDFVLLDENTDKNLKVTPVPKGMGLMTRVGLLYNIVRI